MILVCFHCVHKACTYPCTDYMHESCTYHVIIIFTSPAYILLSEVFVCCAHHCEWILFILGTYYHYGDRTHRHQHWWFHKGWNPCHTMWAAESRPTTLLFCTNPVYTWPNLFFNILFCHSLSDHFNVIFDVFLTVLPFEWFLICTS